MRGLSGKTAIVTVASTLIGQEVVRAFARSDVSVVMADINEADGVALADELGDTVHFVATDVTLDADIDACIATCVSRYGGVDFLINIASTYLYNGLMTNREDWLTALNVNFVGGAIFTQKVSREIARGGGGAIVNYGSIAGKVAQPKRMVYSASKAAILQTTKTQVMFLAGENIRVNSVSPGWTWSNIIRDITSDNRQKADGVAAPFHMLKRTGGPEEVANTVLFLCSDEASFITGTNIAVDGGYTAIGPEQQTDALPELAALYQRSLITPAGPIRGIRLT